MVWKRLLVAYKFDHSKVCTSRERNCSAYEFARMKILKPESEDFSSFFFDQIMFKNRKIEKRKKKS